MATPIKDGQADEIGNETGSNRTLLTQEFAGKDAEIGEREHRLPEGDLLVVHASVQQADAMKVVVDSYSDLSWKSGMHLDHMGSAGMRLFLRAH